MLFLEREVLRKPIKYAGVAFQKKFGKVLSKHPCWIPQPDRLHISIKQITVMIDQNSFMEWLTREKG